MGLGYSILTDCTDFSFQVQGLTSNLGCTCDVCTLSEVGVDEDFDMDVPLEQVKEKLIFIKNGF